MASKETKLERYADLLIRVGINLQEGQTLIINAPITEAGFVAQLTEKAYDAGASNVMVEYSDEKLTRLKMEKAPEEGLKNYPQWKANGLVEMAKNNAAVLNLAAPNPTLLKGIDAKRIAMANKASGEAFREYQPFITGGRISWLIAAVPTKSWAKTVFPDLSEKEAVDELWEKIFYTTRVDQENPVQLWEKHIENMTKNADHLNDRGFRKLHYKGPGTDFSVNLHPKSKWICAQFTNDQGVNFVPNLPTEEVFTIPVRDSVNGTVSSTKPLNYSGNLINNFSLTFKDGKVMEFSAEEGYETLRELLETDEGSSFLGELALVPHNSPISNTDIIFNNTLFDENASCHIALGNALSICVENGKDMSREELKEIGFNESLAHVDFMIGSEQLNIDGEREDGSMEPIFRNGNWAF
ncbi:aminopeptidase [Bacillus salacetis]|uniref:Aminopeptidase n=1 Tax=Bacillus salacetis TaxID=2315464 RepID=A0A3A1R8G7_9BACI|nr:aminopeptidase [Bacillus salacetis]RIW37240.1 aminopeptidase [Bacillus salacetis]